MHALSLQWMRDSYLDSLVLGFCRLGHAPAPFDPMLVKRELSRPILAIVKHRHPRVTNYDELLLLVWVQPRHKNMRARAVGEAEMRSRYVSDLLMQVIAADSRNGRR